MSDASALPAGRYGPAADPRSGRRRTMVLAGLGAALVAVTVWVGLGVAAQPVTWKDVGFTLDGAASVEVVFDVVRIDPGVAVRCRVQALDQQYAQVGIVTVDVAPAQDRVQRFAVEVATTQAATTGLVDSCWVLEP
ncbi:DUF4307 domain-containing protein [Actinotalea sp.]|uniref:DUF4307 domain-containing protein n=1 Tax=Actinotalea sp. TaxID=1872145 RepID=UPI002BFCB579|nr:DUF4307 domain-containing protein [Actinotalea sp.]HQY34190.1 DUF4307 domain-containing protein [Actinotalea sp.]HRA50339.1 DUF4307 domain-containing protein [Actinotalea sp.]